MHTTTLSTTTAKRKFHMCEQGSGVGKVLPSTDVIIFSLSQHPVFTFKDATSYMHSNKKSLCTVRIRATALWAHSSDAWSWEAKASIDAFAASSIYAVIYFSCKSSSHTPPCLSFRSYGAPLYPVALLKYRMVGHPPAPGLCSAPWHEVTRSSAKLTSPKTTAGLFLYFLTCSFQLGACFRHQPHPGEAIHRIKTVFPLSTFVFTKSSMVDAVIFVEYSKWSSGYIAKAEVENKANRHKVAAVVDTLALTMFTALKK